MGCKHLRHDANEHAVVVTFEYELSRDWHWTQVVREKLDQFNSLLNSMVGTCSPGKGIDIKDLQIKHPS